MAYTDYYKVMGVSKDASQDDIKRTYRKLARKYHPDVSKEKDAEAKFKELGEAYAVLSDPKKRAEYDRFGEHWQEGGQRGGFGQQGYAGGVNMGSQQEFEDFLSEIFKNQGGRRHYRPFYDEGEDIHAKLDITLEDSFQGVEKVLKLSGGKNEKTIKVKIPKGILSKQQIRLKGQGTQGASGHAGDLYVEIHILPHPFYHLKGKNVEILLPISPWEAALGTTVTVPTLGGMVQLKIPKRSQTGKQLRLKGRGMPGGTPGDEIVVLSIVIPESDNEAMDKLYEEMAKTANFNPRESMRRSS